MSEKAANPVTLNVEGDVAVISVNNPPVNTVSAPVREGLFAAIADIRAQPGMAAVVLVCEGSTFFSGADIAEFAGPPKEAEFRDLFRQLEQLPVPVVAGMHGVAMGGGLELALACHYRVAAPDARFGLPEVTLGVIPGAGGTQRMPRLIGAEQALELILAARPVDARHRDQARLHRCRGPRRTACRPPRLRPRIAAKRCRTAPHLGAQRGSRDRRRRRSSSGSRSKPRSQYPNRVAALTAIKAVCAAASLPFEQGLLYETELANESKATIESKALVHIFFAERGTRKVPGLPADAKARPIASGGVVGAGTMGGGIAISFANAGLPVTVIDASQEALDRGFAVIGKTYDSMVKRGRLTAADKDRRMALIRGSAQLCGPRRCGRGDRGGLRKP